MAILSLFGLAQHPRISIPTERARSEWISTIFGLLQNWCRNLCFSDTDFGTISNVFLGYFCFAFLVIFNDFSDEIFVFFELDS